MKWIFVWIRFDLCVSSLCVIALIACEPGRPHIIAARHTSVRSDAGHSGDAMAGGDSGWLSLFNGVDLTGWNSYLGKPSPTEPPLGLDFDSLAIFSIVQVDGEPSIRVSGEVWGALTSKVEYCSFHLRLQYRWGTLTWPPLNSFDSGVMYFSTGPFGAVNAGGSALSDPVGSGGFMVSMEYQVSPGDVAGMYNLGPIAFDALTRSEPTAELPGWNDVDIIVQADSSEHLLNGQQVVKGSNFDLNWPGQPAAALSCGKFQLESEGAEIFFRRIELLPLF